MKLLNFLVLISVIFTVGQSTTNQPSKIKHPQEMDLSDLEDEKYSISYGKSKSNNLDCDTFYRRLVKHLLDEKRFEKDPDTEYYITYVPLRLKRDQWELLVNLKIDGLNLNEIDDLLVDVLKQSIDADYSIGKVLLDHYRQQLVDSMNSPIVLSLIAILVIFLTNRIFHFLTFTYSALILFMILGIVVVSYIMTYWDCLSDLEVEQMIQLSKKQSTNNPCKDYDGEHESFFASLRASVMGSSENKCLEHMRKTFKTSQKFCDPLDVLAKWCGKIQMSYFSSIFGGFLKLISELTSSSNFMTKSILSVIGVVAFVFIFLSFGRDVIMHTFKGVFRVITNTRLKEEPPTNTSTTDYHRLSLKMDEILNENRHMKRELSIIRECSVERSLPRNSPPKIKDTDRFMEGIDEETI